MTLEKTQQADIAILLMNPEGTLLFCQVNDLTPRPCNFAFPFALFTFIFLTQISNQCNVKKT